MCVYIHMCTISFPYNFLYIQLYFSPVFSAKHLIRTHIPQSPLHLPPPTTVIIQASTFIYIPQWILYNPSYIFLIQE